MNRNYYRQIKHLRRTFITGEDAFINRGISMCLALLLTLLEYRHDYFPDNNAIERQQRYISLSRRNSLFFGSHAGAERTAMIYLLACSCRLNGINTFEYSADILNRLAYISPNAPDEVFQELLPNRWTKK